MLKRHRLARSVISFVFSMVQNILGQFPHSMLI